MTNERDSNISGAQNLKSLQILRFIAATSVAYLHLYVTPNFGAFGVDIFFVLSGFVIALVTSTQKSPTLFAINRLTRIVPIYWLLTTFLLLIIFIKPEYVHETTAASATFLNYIKSLLFIPYYGASDMKPLLRVGWTLNYEMLFYFCVWIALIFTKRFTLVIALLILLTLYIMLGNVWGNKLMNEFFGSELIFEFGLGIAAYKIYANKILNKISKYLLIIVSVVAYGFMAIAEANEYSGSRFIVFGVPSFLLVICAVGLESFVEELNKTLVSTLTSMGDASYATYLTHWYVIVAFRKIASEKLHLFEFYSAQGALFTLCAALIAGQLTYKYADKPLNSKLKKYFSKIFIKPAQPQL